MATHAVKRAEAPGQRTKAPRRLNLDTELSIAWPAHAARVLRLRSLGRLAAALLLAILSNGAHAHAADAEHWIAVSNTAMSITGDVQFSPSHILFANQAALPLARSGGAIGLTWAPAMADQPVQLYHVTAKRNPRLLNGNFLCGPTTPPSYVSVLEHGADVYLTIFSGGGVPAKDFASRICAGFAYSLK